MFFYQYKSLYTDQLGYSCLVSGFLWDYVIHAHFLRAAFLLVSIFGNIIQLSNPACGTTDPSCICDAPILITNSSDKVGSARRSYFPMRRLISLKLFCSTLVHFNLVFSVVSSVRGVIICTHRGQISW